MFASKKKFAKKVWQNLFVFFTMLMLLSAHVVRVSVSYIPFFQIIKGLLNSPEKYLGKLWAYYSKIDALTDQI